MHFTLFRNYELSVVTSHNLGLEIGNTEHSRGFPPHVVDAMYQVLSTLGIKKSSSISTPFPFPLGFGLTVDMDKSKLRLIRLFIIDLYGYFESNTDSNSIL